MLSQAISKDLEIRARLHTHQLSHLAGGEQGGRNLGVMEAGEEGAGGRKKRGDAGYPRGREPGEMAKVSQFYFIQPFYSTSFVL